MKSISNQILAYILFSLSIVFTALFVFHINYRFQFEAERLRKGSVISCERLAWTYSNSIRNNDLNSVKSKIGFDVLEEHINSIQIVDRDNKLYAGVIEVKDQVREITNNEFLNLRQDSIVSPILYKGQMVGKVVLYPNDEPLKEYLAGLKQFLLIEYLVAFLAIAVILFFVLRIRVINPLLSLKDWVSNLDKDKNVEPKLHHSTEVDVIIDSVLQLTERLNSSHEENLKKSRELSEKESLIASVSVNLQEGMIFRLIISDDGTRKFTYLSNSFREKYGFSPEEGMADHTITHGKIADEDVERFWETEAIAIRDLSIFRIEVKMINPDGSTRVSRFVSSPTVLEDGSVCWDGIEFDITDLKKAQSDLQQSQFLLQSIAEGLPDIVFAKDLEGRYLFVNSAFSTSAKLNTEDILGKNGSEIFPTDDAVNVNNRDKAIIESGVAQTYEDPLTTPSGEVVYLTTKGPIKDVQGKIVGTFGIARDITELKKAQTALQQSQFLLQSIADGLPDSIFAKGLDGGFLFVNSALAKRANKSQEELLGKKNSDIFPPDQAQKLLATDLEIMKSEEIRSYEEQLATSSGNVTFLTTKGPLKDVQGKPVGLFGIARDITKRKREEEALRVSQEKFEFAFNSNPDGLIIMDAQSGVFKRFNNSAVKMLGYSHQDEIVGKTGLELDVYKDNVTREKIYEDLDKYGYIQDMEVIWHHKSGTTVQVVLNAEYHYINNERLLYVVAQDITERKQVEAELQKLNLDKDRFVSILGHDLRGPIGGISSSLEFVKMNILEMEIEDVKEAVDLMHHSAESTYKLLEDVLSWTRAQLGKLSFDPQIINFKKDCFDVVDLLQFTATAKNITIETCYEDSLSVYADKNMLATVLRNLISNALKFTLKNGKITITADKVNESTVVAIADNGVGIAPEDIDKIFDKSQLFTSIGTNAEKGTGFGLKLCQEFIKKHDGKIWVESEVGKGTTFYFSLPDIV